VNGGFDMATPKAGARNIAKLKELQVEVAYPPTARLQMLRGETVVVKYGGHALHKSGTAGFASDVAYLTRAGVRVVVVHGGGPEISQEMEKAGIEPSFVHGHRVTDADTLKIAERVLSGRVNRELVTALEKAGCRAVGISGRDGSLLRAKYRKPRVKDGAGHEVQVNLGYVGDIERVNTRLLQLLQGGGYTPVIAPIGVTAGGQSLNINADSVAGAIAGALKATTCVFLTDVKGILQDPSKPETVLPAVRYRDAEGLIATGAVSGGMLPKVQACLESLSHGSREARIADGREDHALLNALLPAEPKGTAVTP
jgi:acetylglutamate kinase